MLDTPILPAFRIEKPIRQSLTSRELFKLLEIQFGTASCEQIRPLSTAASLQAQSWHPSHRFLSQTPPS